MTAFSTFGFFHVGSLPTTAADAASSIVEFDRENACHIAVLTLGIGEAHVALKLDVLKKGYAAADHEDVSDAVALLIDEVVSEAGRCFAEAKCGASGGEVVVEKEV